LYGLPLGQQFLNAFEERLHDNTQTPVPEQAAFRIDFPAWRRTRSHRDRQIIDKMLQNERTLDLAKEFGVCPARISQLRQEFYQDWMRFHGDASAQVTSAA
jgi:hypothetical protein